MKDILGRDIKPGDAVVCMAIGRDSSGMHFGIQTEGKGVKTLDGIKNSRNRFLVTNPTEQELSIIEEIKSKYKEQEENKIKQEQERKLKKAIPYKDLQFCHIYEDDKGDKFVFLGYCKIKINYKYRNNSLDYEGYTYVRVTNSYDYTKDIIYLPRSSSSAINHIKWTYSIVKTKKRLVSHIGLHKNLYNFICQNHDESSKDLHSYSYKYDPNLISYWDSNYEIKVNRIK